jgi:hypothetical protein
MAEADEYEPQGGVEYALDEALDLLAALEDARDVLRNRSSVCARPGGAPDPNPQS